MVVKAMSIFITVDERSPIGREHSFAGTKKHFGGIAYLQWLLPVRPIGYGALEMYSCQRTCNFKLTNMRSPRTHFKYMEHIVLSRVINL